MRIIGGKHRGAKLYTLDGFDTRPTLDRVKEPLFSILNFALPDAVVLDLFAGSGALGLEAISRGAKQAFLSDSHAKAIHIIEQNVEKLRETSKVQIMHKDYLVALETLKKQQIKFDLVFLDPPYETDFAQKATQQIVQLDLLNKNGVIVIEADRKKEIMNAINEIELIEIYDERKYGRAELIFARQKR